jgi:hypothetical protein
MAGVAEDTLGTEGRADGRRKVKSVEKMKGKEGKRKGKKERK